MKAFMKKLSAFQVKSNVFSSAFIVTVFFALAFSSHAEQMYKRTNWDIHYIAFPSTFVQPNIAKHYNLERSGTNGIVNISVLDNTQAPTKPLSVKVTGKYRNLVGNFGTLEFKEVIEKDAIYYLAEFPYTNQETFRFEITVSDGKKSETIKFKDQFYVD